MIVLGLAVGSAGILAGALPDDQALAGLLERIRGGYNLPALGAAVVGSDGVRTKAVVGFRKRGDGTRATSQDLWHLGSDTKAMTATMLAALVEQGKLSWDSTIAGVFPLIRLPAQEGSITLLQLLTHRAGLPHDTDWRGLSASGTLVEQRREAVARLGSVTLLSPPGAKYAYSNWGYVVAGAMAEQVTGKSYEELMQAIIFDPLHMASVGYGAPGTHGQIDQPWGHSSEGMPIQGDNPLVMAPAGCVHCSLDDWGKFIADQLRGAEGKPALLSPESYVRLHSAPFGGDYAPGWLVADRKWGGGSPVFTHTGSNTLNLAVAWMAPARDFAVLIVCNQGATERPCDEVAGAIISHIGK
jgi:CubicO group peptidase (beta-lactamase class C family)